MEPERQHFHSSKGWGISGGQNWREPSLLIDNRIPVAWSRYPIKVYSTAAVFIAEYYQFNAVGTRIDSINLIRFFKHQSCLVDYFLSSKAIKSFQCFEYLINDQTWKKLFLIEVWNSARHVWLQAGKAGGGVDLPSILLYAENASQLPPTGIQRPFSWPSTAGRETRPDQGWDLRRNKH